MQKKLPILTYRFRYSGTRRIVENVTVEGPTIIGMEVRKAGKFSNKIKRYSFDRMEDVTWKQS